MPLFSVLISLLAFLRKKKSLITTVFFLLAHLNNKSSYKMQFCTKIFLSHSHLSLEISQVFDAELVKTDLW